MTPDTKTRIDPTPVAVTPAAAATLDDQPAGDWRSRLEVGPLLRNLLPVAALIVMFIYFSARSESFLSTQNLTIMTGEAGILLLTALGATMVIIMGSVDLSVGSAALISGAVVAKVLNSGAIGVVWVILLALAVGVAVGLVNGLVFAYGRVPSFITTLGTLSLFSGIGLTFMAGSSISFTAPSVQKLATGQLITHVQNAALIALVVFAAVWFISRRTRLGLYLYALGGNETVVQLSGIRVNRIKVIAMVLSAVTAALGGLLMAAELNSAGPSLGSTTLLDSIAAIVIGGTALSGGRGGVERTLLGVLILTVLSDGLNQLEVQSYTQTIIKGAVIVIAAVFAMAARRNEVIK
jgi:ribose transport system permease protein